MSDFESEERSVSIGVESKQRHQPSASHQWRDINVASAAAYHHLSAMAENRQSVAASKKKARRGVSWQLEKRRQAISVKQSISEEKKSASKWRWRYQRKSAENNAQNKRKA